ncbi:MAG: hypothetical protein F6K14_12520 [Symploca sp. SIO2C1]|nr:hypothetical protein [Symploca sp. SIO2C1]
MSVEAMPDFQETRQEAEDRREENLACFFHSSRVAIAARGAAFKKLVPLRGI